MDFGTVVGFVAGCVTVVSFVPQVVRIWRTRQTRDLSFGTFALLGTGALLWFLYGLLTAAWPVVFTNAAVALLVGIILLAKVRFDRVIPDSEPAKLGRE
jgi:MtN3 and saliva related transmembrane protein